MAMSEQREAQYKWKVIGKALVPQLEIGSNDVSEK